jgi:hypothetical protein
MTYEAPESLWLLEGGVVYARTPSTGVSITQGGLNYGFLPCRRSSRVHELANGLRLGTVVPSQDLSGLYVIVCGGEPAGAST